MEVRIEVKLGGDVSSVGVSLKWIGRLKMVRTTEDKKVVEGQDGEIGYGRWGKFKVAGKFGAFGGGMSNERLEGQGRNRYICSRNVLVEGGGD